MTQPESSPPDPIRIALFVSDVDGHHILTELLEPTTGRAVRVVGVVTDDPYAPYSGAGKRLWGRLDADQIAHRVRLIRDTCARHGLPCYDGRVQAPPRKMSAVAEAEAFARLFVDTWRPDVVYMCVFGQRIPPPVFGAPRFGFFNIHPSRIDRLDEWPRYGGPTPFRAMRQAGETHFNLVLHRIDETFDGGAAVGISAPIPLVMIPGRGLDPASRAIAHDAMSALIRRHLAGLSAPGGRRPARSLTRAGLPDDEPQAPNP